MCERELLQNLAWNLGSEGARKNAGLILNRRARGRKEGRSGVNMKVVVQWTKMLKFSTFWWVILTSLLPSCYSSSIRSLNIIWQWVCVFVYLFVCVFNQVYARKEFEMRKGALLEMYDKNIPSKTQSIWKRRLNLLILNLCVGMFDSFNLNVFVCFFLPLITRAS